MHRLLGIRIETPKAPRGEDWARILKATERLWCNKTWLVDSNKLYLTPHYHRSFQNLSQTTPVALPIYTQRTSIDTLDVFPANLLTGANHQAISTNQMAKMQTELT